MDKVKGIFIHNIYLFLLSICCLGCTTVEISTEESNELLRNSIERDSSSYEFHLSGGEIGFVIDTRPIFSKGYSVTKAEISFPDHQRFDTVLTIDKYSNIAIFSIESDSLTPEEKESFDMGVSAVIEVSNDNEVLSSYDDSIVLDYQNTPVIFQTNKEFIIPPVILKEETPYEIMFEKQYGTFDSPSIGVLTRTPFNFPGLIMDFEPFTDYDFSGDQNTGLQQYYFQHVEGNKYKIRTPQVCRDINDDTAICDEFTGNSIFEDGWFGAYPLEFDPNIIYISSLPIEDEENAAIFELIPSEEGWLSINLIFDNQSYPLTLWDRFLGFDNYGESPPARIRIVSDNIEWKVEQTGITFHQPVMGPTRIDFAYEAILRNCSSATLMETVGNTQTKTQTSTLTTSESLSLFAGIEISAELGIKLGTSATIGAEVPELGEASATQTREVSFTLGAKFSTSVTYTKENTIESSVSEVNEVSRVREISIPPYSTIEITDAVKRVSDIRIPFAMILKISGFDDVNKEQLTGPEIVSQLKNNLFEGLISNVGSNFVEITIRGSTLVNDFFNSQTVVQDGPTCPN